MRWKRERGEGESEREREGWREGDKERGHERENLPRSLTYCRAQITCLLSVGCLMSQQQASVSQGRIRSDNCTCCHTEIEVAEQTFHFTQSQYTDTGQTSPSTDPITPGAWQDSHRSANVGITSMTRIGKIPTAKSGIELVSVALEAGALTARPTWRHTGESSRCDLQSHPVPSNLTPGRSVLVQSLTGKPQYYRV